MTCKENSPYGKKNRLECLDDELSIKSAIRYKKKLANPNVHEKISYEASVVRQVFSSMLDSWDRQLPIFQWFVIFVLGGWNAAIVLFAVFNPNKPNFPLELNNIMTFYGVVFGALVVVYSLIVTLYRKNFVEGGNNKVKDQAAENAAWEVLRKYRPYLFFLFSTLIGALLLLVSDLLLRLIFGYDVSNPYVRAIIIWPIVPYTAMLVLAVLGLVSYTTGMGRYEFRTQSR